jgi:oxygen-independent coproporphyrinogen-3 oxidase
MSHVRHLYVHLPFCAHRCGYCDFVTVVGRAEAQAGYVDALLAELALERHALAPALDTVFLGGGTPTLTRRDELIRLLNALPPASELTVEANPETVTPDLARALRDAGVTRVSLGAQTFQAHLLAMLERRADPDTVRRAFYDLRDASFDNISLDLIYGIPGQSAADLRRDLEEAIRLGPRHVSYYELEAKEGTRFSHAWGEELARQADAMESYLELVVETLEGAGFRWYETANFCRDGMRARHNLAYWQGRDYLGLGIGAVSTVAGRRWRNRPQLRAYVKALAAGTPPGRELEPLDASTLRRERLMLGLRLDEGVPLNEVNREVDSRGVERMERLGLVELRDETIALTRRGRLLGTGVTVELLAEASKQDVEPRTPARGRELVA